MDQAVSLVLERAIEWDSAVYDLEIAAQGEEFLEERVAKARAVTEARNQLRLAIVGHRQSCQFGD